MSKEEMTLVKHLETKDIIAISLGFGACASTWGSAMIGVGSYGAGFFLAIIVVVAIYIMIAMNYSEVATMYPSAASMRTYVEKAFNLEIGMVGSMLYLLSFMFGVSGEVSYVSHALQAAFPEIHWRIWVLVITLIFGLIINLLGITKLSVMEKYLAIIVIIITIMAAAQALTGLSVEEPDPDRLKAMFSGGIEIGGFFSAFLLAMWMFCGFEVVCPLAEECKQPEKALPRGMFAGLGIMGALKVIFTFAAAMFITSEVLISDGAFTALGEAMMGKVGFYIMVLFVFACSAALVMANTSSMPRLIYGMAQTPNNMMPKALAYLHPKYRTPWKAQFLYWGIVTAIMQIFGDDTTLIICMSSFIWIMQYLLMMIVTLRLRTRRPNDARPYRIPGPFSKSPIITWITLITLFVFAVLSVVPPFGDINVLIYGGLAVVAIVLYTVVWIWSLKKRGLFVRENE